jgi:hypothetical protein
MPRNKENKVADAGALTLLRRHRLRGHILYSAQLELELIQTHMAQKPMLRVEVCARA